MSNIQYYCLVPLGFLIVFSLAFARHFGAEGTLNRIFPKKIITGPDGSPYMHRWFLIRTRNFALFCHKFVRSDYDRALHDHPWNFLVIPIWRGYIEYSEQYTWLPVARRVYPIIGTRFRKAEFKHRVELMTEKAKIGFGPNGYVNMPKPSWSLFFRFRKRRHWGFWCPQGWRPWVEGKPDHCDDSVPPSKNVKRHLS